MTEFMDIMSLWDFRNPAESEKRFREVLPQAEKLEDNKYYLELLTQIARTYSLRGAFARAHDLLDEVEPLLNRDQARPVICYLLERGRTWNSAGDKVRARELFLQAWDLASAVGEEALAVDAAHMMGIVQPPEEQLQWNKRALEIAESSENPRARKWAGSLYNNLGWSYFDLGKYEEAEKVFAKGVKWQEEHGDVVNLRIARWALARSWRALGKVKKALQMQQQLHKEIEESGVAADGYVFEELAECHLLLDSPEAGHFFSLAYDTLSQDNWLVKNEPERLERLQKLAQK